MLIQLTVNLEDHPAPIRAEMADLLGRAYTEALRRGMTGDLHTIDLSALDNEPEEDSPDLARAKGFGDGYGAGFGDGWRKAETMLGAAPAPQPPSQFLPLGHLPATPDVDTLLNETRLTPAQTQTPEETTGILPRYADDGRFRTLDAMQAAADRGAPPEGERPKAEPGAPISAYDELSPSTAADFYGFPDYPDDRSRHTDDEGAGWVFSGYDPRGWHRTSYPAEWGPAAAGGFPEVKPDAVKLTGE